MITIVFTRCGCIHLILTCVLFRVRLERSWRSRGTAAYPTRRSRCWQTLPSPILLFSTIHPIFTVQCRLQCARPCTLRGLMYHIVLTQLHGLLGETNLDRTLNLRCSSIDARPLRFAAISLETDGSNTGYDNSTPSRTTRKPL